MPRSYIAFLDADDAWNRKFYVDNVASLLEQNYDLVGFQSCECDAKMRRRNEPCKLENGIFSGGIKSLWIHATQSFAAMLYSCEFLKKYNIRFDEKIHYSEDKIFSMQALYLANNIYLSNRLMYSYRKNVSSAMNSRQYGIGYFIPIIDAYIESDKLMEKWKCNQRAELCEGTVLASIYIMDMIDEHFQHFGKRKEIEKIFGEKKEYLYILCGATKCEKCIRPNERYLKYKKSPLRYCISNNIKGCILYSTKIFGSIPWVKAIINKYRYSIPI